MSTIGPKADSGLAGEHQSFKQIARDDPILLGNDPGTEESAHEDLRQAYLELLKKSLCGLLNGGDGAHWRPRGWRKLALRLVLPRDVSIQRTMRGREREEGRDWPSGAQTMIGLKRLNNLQACVESVIRDRIPGDLIETGVWRGGACIFMRAILRAYGVTDRVVWLADSFAGLPKPDARKYPEDAGDRHHTYENLAVSLEEVKGNFRRHDLLDGQVRFLPGWFKDTLPEAPLDKLAVVRLDGDLYESTMDAMASLYPKLTVGGYLIVDDYHAVPACQKAITDYRARHGISEEMIRIDWSGIYWRRER